MSGGRRSQRLQLVNREGRKLTIILREYMPGDEEGMIACIRDEYKDTYFKRAFYCPDYLKKEAKSGRITFLAAQTKAGEIAGMMILKEFAPKEDMCEIATQIFRKKYRGYGLAMPFFQYGMEILLSKEYSAAYCLPVLFHNTTQMLLHRLGMQAAGVVLNVFDMSRITHSYKNGRNVKHSQGIQIRAVKKQNAGIIYLPKEHQAFGRQIYEALRVRYCIGETEDKGKKELPPVSCLSYRQEEAQSSLTIDIHSIGCDLPERIKELHEKFPLKGKQTVNIFLNVSDKNAVWAYDILTDMGYFFTGLKPLCSEREYMVLHHLGEVKVFLEDYVVSEEFKRILDYIKVFLKKAVKRKELQYEKAEKYSP